MSAHEIYLKSDGEATKEYYSRLNAIGPRGKLATALMRVLKRSRNPEGIGYRMLPPAQRSRRRKAEQFDRSEAYQWAINELQRVLITHFSVLAGYAFGYLDGFLYVVLLEGKPVRFSCHERGLMPEYSGPLWIEAEDREMVALRIIQFCDSVDKPVPPKEAGPDIASGRIIRKRRKSTE